MKKLACGNIHDYQTYSQFKDVKDFNNHIEQWMIDIKSAFTKSELIALKRLIRYSCKVVGVCNAKIQTIVASTHAADNSLGISRSTFERMLRKARKLGLLVIHNTAKKSGYKAHNVYVFLRYADKQKGSVETVDCAAHMMDKPSNNHDTKTTGSRETNVNEVDVQRTTNDSEMAPDNSFSEGNEVSEQENIDASIETIHLLKTSNKKRTKRHKTRDENNLPVEFTASRVPQKFVELASCFFQKARTVEELWKIITISNYYTKYDQPTMVELACDALRQLVRHMKRRTVRKTIFALYWGIVKEKMNVLYFEDLYELGFPTQGEVKFMNEDGGGFGLGG